MKKCSLLIASTAIVLAGCTTHPSTYHLQANTNDSPNVAISFLTTKDRDGKIIVEGSLFQTAKVSTPDTGYLLVSAYDTSGTLIYEKNAYYQTPISHTEWSNTGVHFSVPLDIPLTKDSKIEVAFKHPFDKK